MIPGSRIAWLLWPTVLCSLSVVVYVFHAYLFQRYLPGSNPESFRRFSAAAGGLIGYNWSGVKQDVQQSGASSLGIDVVEMPDGSLKVNIPSNVSFDTDKSQLKPALLPVLDSVARALNQHPELRTKVVGHTDSTGSAAHNQQLSVNRARAVTSYLGKQGVAQGRMTVEGRGANDPVGDNATAEGRAANRRIEVYLYAVKQ
ncbi:OmpA family protein [Bordetella pertussis]|uniref:OmpA family protein n=1 Tax=Bordetella pertussis TaxID=520 RepID=UPI001F20BA83|nr:OmpA family protein [Bordetella pertussis]